MSNLAGVHIDGYSFHHECRADKRGGGVGIFMNSSIKHTPRDNLRVNVSKIKEISQFSGHAQKIHSAHFLSRARLRY